MKKYYLPISIATIATLFIRFTLYTEGCNLIVMAMTWLVILLLILGVGKLVSRRK